MRDLWPCLRKIAIDHAVAEPAAARGPRRRSCPRPWGGTTSATSTRSPTSSPVSTTVPGITVIGPADDIISIDSTATVAAGGRLVALIGVDDLVVVDTQDALLITTPERAQEVKQIVEALTAQGRTRADMTAERGAGQGRSSRRSRHTYRGLSRPAGVCSDRSERPGRRGPRRIRNTTGHRGATVEA